MVLAILEVAHRRHWSGLGRVWVGAAYSGRMAASGMGGLVGELALSDASLSALLSDIRQALTQYGPVAASPEKSTTGSLTKELLGIEKRYPALLPIGFRPWLVQVQSVAEQRNAVVHAIGRDRCVDCGRSSTFEHKNKPIDRSEHRLRMLISDVDALLAQGIELAGELSDKLNELLLDEARRRARATGDPQFPPQINIAGGWHRCGSCTSNGQAETVIAAPPATAVLPPGTVQRLFGA
ncbi:hypothetical protein [Nocardia shimofusensis]|uniref:hypothetical protein n=1 Tax=Nocardia shimofusensis TaxID=228596 RepID=UPI0008314A23|nr:hypothetical protein [Nocardia shimofusensis]